MCKLNKFKVAIDAGHGGSDPGAVDLANIPEDDFITTYEKNLNISIVKKVSEKLKSQGVNVVLTRNLDEFVSLNERVSIANKAKVDLFVSIHFNAGSSLAYGIETFTYEKSVNPVSMKLANNVHSEVMKIAGLTNRGLKKAEYYVLKYTNMATILIELGFITNTKEELLINNNEWQLKISDAIANGIIKTLA
jgi:N-acetylmuramoyl-L-alanine amidase